MLFRSVGRGEAEVDVEPELALVVRVLVVRCLLRSLCISTNTLRYQKETGNTHKDAQAILVLARVRTAHRRGIKRFRLAVLHLNIDDGVRARVRRLRDLDAAVRVQALGDERELVRGDGEGELRVCAVRILERALRVLDPCEVLLAYRRLVLCVVLLGVLPEPLRVDVQSLVSHSSERDEG